MAWVISAAGLAVIILTATVTVTWKLSRVEVGIRAEYIAADALNAAANAVLAAKLYQIEIWVRDEFVRKGSFEIVVTRMEIGMRDLGIRFEGAVDKMTARIETLSDHK